MAGLSVGIDVGGTFTDVVAIDADGRVTARKVLSTPSDQSEGVLAGIRALGARPEDVERIAHGTTVATNALLERTGARVALCATQGATDLLDLRRQERASLYDLTRHHPDPLVPAALRVAVEERIAPEGVLVPLSAAAAGRAADAVVAGDAEIAAVALLHAYDDPRHERAMGDAIRARSADIDIVLSSDVLPEIREYERTATTVAEAYLRPTVSTYLRRLAERLTSAGFPAPVVMTSAGGMLDATEASRAAASLALSGPAGGVVGAAYVARLAGIEDALTIDIGGTSADAGLVLGGEPLAESGGAIAGVPIALPRVLVETVSAGGGSIGWVDDGGALRVGPRSAGAIPGPAAFGRGGKDATVTDAHVVLERIGEQALSGGVALRPPLALAAVEKLARLLGRDVTRTATAMIAAADAAIARSLRRVSIERGVDPRRCTLVGFGGGGPLHACSVAERLDVRRVLAPSYAGVLSALGLALAPMRRETLASMMRLASTLDGGTLGRTCDALAQRAGLAESRRWWVRARYQGQGHELDVPVSPGDDGGTIARRFAELHARRAGFTLEREVEIVTARHAAVGQGRDATLEPPQLVRRATLRGPATVALPDATLHVAPGWRGQPLATGGWILERDT